MSKKKARAKKTARKTAPKPARKSARKAKGGDGRMCTLCHKPGHNKRSHDPGGRLAK